MKAINMLLVLILMVVFADYSEAGIIKKTYDEASDETTVQYEVVSGDNSWNIYKEVIPEKITMDGVEQKIMKPNNITEPRSLSVGIVLVIKVKGKNLKTDNLQNEKPATVENSKIVEIAADVAMERAVIKEDVPFVSVKNPESQKNISSDMVGSGVPVKDALSKSNAESELIASLGAAEKEIARLREAIAIKDQQILLIANERDKLINNKVSKDGSEKEHPQRVMNNQNRVESYSEKIALENYYKKRTLWSSGVLFAVFVLAILLVWWRLKEGSDKYNREKEERLAATG